MLANVPPINGVLIGLIPYLKEPFLLSEDSIFPASKSIKLFEEGADENDESFCFTAKLHTCRAIRILRLSHLVG